MTSLLQSYLPLLLLTLAIELLVVSALAPRRRRREAVTVAAALNLLTHPAATLLGCWWFVDLLSLEVLALLVEWLGYMRLLRVGPVVALRLSLPANALSGLVGLLLAMAG